MLLASTAATSAQAPKTAAASKARATRPKLVVVLVVDQMRADYVDKFRGQWKGGLARLLREGAWFRAAAYPYAATETCVGHATISTGALPASHGMVANAWWDRDQQVMVTCTSDPKATNSAYAGGTTTGGDSAWRMQLPSFAEELKFQTGGATRVVTFSLKARAAITLAGHKADAVAWFDASSGSWVTSPPYGTMPFVEAFVKEHPAADDYGKTWALSMPESRYLYDEAATGVATLEGWSRTFPHPLRGNEGSSSPDAPFYAEWSTSPFADTYLTKLAEASVDSLGLGKSGGTDYLGVGYSSIDYVGHTFGPRSWEIQDILARLDQDLGELFAQLDAKVGKGNYLVVLTADHGVAPIPEDMKRTGFEAGVLNLAELKDRLEKALEPFNYTKPAVARIAGNEVYFSAGVYGQLQQDPAAMKAVVAEALAMPGVAAVYRADELSSGNKTVSETRRAVEMNYYAGRSGDLYILQKPYWLTESSAEGSKRYTGTGHGSAYAYDQRVPLFFLGFGIVPGEYFGAVTPADIAPTLGALTGVTLATNDGRILAEALEKRAGR